MLVIIRYKLFVIVTHPIPRDTLSVQRSVSMSCPGVVLEVLDSLFLVERWEVIGLIGMGR